MTQAPRESDAQMMLSVLFLLVPDHTKDTLDVGVENTKLVLPLLVLVSHPLPPFLLSIKELLLNQWEFVTKCAHVVAGSALFLD